MLTADETGYGFRHALLREVVHDDLLPGQHARLHATFAALLEEHPELVGPGTAPLEIAHHWSAAHEVTKAFQWSITAARSGAAAYHEALKMYERALELWDRVDDPVAIAGSRASVLKQAANAASNAGEERAGTRPGQRGRWPRPVRTTTAKERITALMLKGSLLSGLLRPGSVEPMREAMALLPDDADPVLRGRVLEALARRLMLSGEIAEGVATARAAVAAATGIGSAAGRVARPQHPGHRAGRRSAKRPRPRPSGSGRAVLARGSTKTELRYFINYSDALNLTGRYADAVSQALAGIELARERGLERSIGCMLAGNAAEPLLALGQWSRASAMIDRALELDPPAHHTAHLRLLQAWLRVWRGELDEADVILRRVPADDHRGQPGPAVRQPDDPGRRRARHGGRRSRAGLARRDGVPRQLGPLPRGVRLSGARRRRRGGAGPRRRRGRLRALAIASTDFLDRRALRINIRPLWAPVITAELADTADGWRTALAELTALPGPAHLPPYAGLRLAQHLVAARERAEARDVLAVAHGAGGGARGPAADRPARRAGPAGRVRRRRRRPRPAHWPG